MDELGQAAEEQVILVWLQAEIGSPRFQERIVGHPPGGERFDAVRALVKDADLSDAGQNQERREILAEARGFGRGQAIFAGLDDDIAWQKVRLNAEELGAAVYVRDKGWMILAPTTRTVREGADNVGVVLAGDANMHILSLARKICHGQVSLPLPELVFLQRPDGKLSILEGNARATAYMLEAHLLTDGIEAYVGRSLSVANWKYL